KKNLLETNQTASKLLDTRFNDLKNENAMLECELNQVKGDLKQMSVLFENCQKERDKLKAEASSAGNKDVVNSTAYQDMAEKLEKLTAKNRLLAEENKKLEDKNRDLQRDVAHLTKKVDKNRAEIKSLNDQIESGLTSDSNRQFSEIARIYESTIDKAEDLIYRLQTEFSLAHSKAEDIKTQD
ncbi:MAG: hypothetical protein ACI4IQ_00495, partial [Eubacterium sp.]